MPYQQTLNSLEKDDSSYLQLVDFIKGVAIIWIILNHYSERIIGFPFFANTLYSF